MTEREQGVGLGDGPNARPGVWSVTVEIDNAGGQDLVLDPANTTPPICWVGAPPEWGSTLPVRGTVTIGAAVYMPQEGVTMVLGYRNGEQVPVTIQAGNGPGTQNGCSVQPGSGTTGVVTQLASDPQHLLFAVKLASV
jgi:hypothetical protein